MKKSAQKGFTLIELLVVIAIIGLLASMVFASLGGARRSSRITAAQGNLRSLFTGWVLCADSNGTITPPTESNDGSGIAFCSNAAATTATYVALPAGWDYCDTQVAGTCPGVS